MNTMKRSLAHQSLTVNITTSLSLAAICFACYVTILTIFCTQGLHSRSLTDVEGGAVPPTTIISILGIILIGATSALVTRAVEDRLWSNILREDSSSSKQGSSPREEYHRQAQWSVSPLARLIYAVQGHSWPVRISGILLLSTAVINPVLLYGIRQDEYQQTTDVGYGSRDGPFSGFVSAAGAIHDADDPVTMGTLMHLKKFRLPASPLCTESSCSVEARATALQAVCAARSATWLPPFSNDDGQPVGGPFAPQVHCSTFGKDTCVLMQGVPVETHVNFTLGPSTARWPRINGVLNGTVDVETLGCPAGDFAVLVGVWYAKSSQDSLANATSKSWHTVDCRIQYGSISIHQDGASTPTLDRDSFVKSTDALKLVGGDYIVEDPANYNMSAPLIWQMTYLSKAAYGTTGASAPFTFAVGDNKLEGSLILAQALLGAPFEGDWSSLPLTTNRDDAEHVAQDLEASFDAATILAFVAAPNAASYNITTTISSRIWTYDTHVLPILAIPLLATILVCSICWRVHGNDTVIGYDPLEIARRAGEIFLAPNVTDDVVTSDSELCQLTPGGRTSDNFDVRTPEQ